MSLAYVGDLTIVKNASLETTSTLEKFSGFRGTLRIAGNNSLTSFHGLENISFEKTEIDVEIGKQKVSDLEQLVQATLRRPSSRFATNHTGMIKLEG